MAIDFKKKLSGGSSTQIDFVKRLSGLKLEEPKPPVVDIASTNNKTKWYEPITATVKGATTDYKREGQSWNQSGNVAGNALVKSTVENANRLQHSFDNYLNDPNSTWADAVAGVGNVAFGLLNQAFAFPTAILKGAETVPVIGFAAEGFNRVMAGLGSGGAKAGDLISEHLPFVSDENEEKLRPVFEEIGALLGIVKGMKVAGKATGKVAESKYVKPHIEELNRKVTEASELLAKDPSLKTQAAQFVAEHGPVRNLPTISETPTGRQVPASPKQKHAAYAEKQGYEPYQSPDTLPVIQMGEGGKPVDNSGLPVIDAYTGKYVSEPTGGEPMLVNEQIPFGEKQPTPTSQLLIERQNAPAVTTPKQAEPIKSSAEEVQSVPKKTEEEVVDKDSVVTVNGGTYQLKGETLANYKQKLAEHNERMSRLREEYAQAKTIGRREQIQKDIKAEGMQWSAKVREITGNLTAVEIKTRINYEKSNYVGKSVLVKVNGKWVKATVASRPSFGNIKVKLEDGSEVSVKTGDIKDPRTAKEIKEQITKRDEASLYGEEKAQETPINRDFDDPTVEMVKTEDIAPFIEYDRKKFPRYSTEKVNELREDIKKNGIKEPLILYYGATKGNIILGEGNHRLMIAKELGITEVPVRVVRNSDLFKSTLSTHAESPKKAPLKVEPDKYGYIPGNMKPSEVGIKTVKKEEVKREPEYLSEEYNNMLLELELAEPGKRNFTPKEGTMDYEVTGQSSTFPKWIPDDLRLSKYTKQYIKDRQGTTEDLDITYKKGSPMDRMHKAFIEELKFREEITNKERETARLEEMSRQYEPKEDTSIAEAEYYKAQERGGVTPTETTATGEGKQTLLEPVSGAGEQRIPTLSQRVVDEVASEIQRTVEANETPMPSGTTWKTQAEGAIKGFDANPELAMDYAMGRAIPPPNEGIVSTAYWVEAYRRAKLEGDTQRMIDLSRSDVTGASKRYGQEIGYLSNMEKGTELEIYGKVAETWKKSYEAKTGKKADVEVVKTMAEMERAIKESAMTKDQIIKFINDIKKC